MPINQESYEKFIKYVNRISAIDQTNPTIDIETHHGANASLSWQQRPTDYTSKIILFYSDSAELKHQGNEDWKIRPRNILSLVLVGEDMITKKRNPLDSVRVLLTVLAVITELSHTYGRFTHIVRANEQSAPLYDLLVKLGIYYLSDEAGKSVDKPKKWNSDFILYACKYPVDGMPDLSMFAPKKYVDVLSRIYGEHAVKMKDSY
ncbi:hypothetical protein KBC89_01260 [Candidatus Woesebacteria bacterium]|nr:hypothetical protein [Candidatus Woesebacteria bacterium]